MIKIESINPTGFFSYGIHRTIKLDNQGLILLNGKNTDRKGGSNGAGKSSLAHTLTQILFGKNPTDESGEDIINRKLSKAWGRVVFFDKNGAKWRITDVKKWRKTDKYPDENFDGYVEEPSEHHRLGNRYSGTDLYLEKWNPDLNTWTDERASNAEAGEVRLSLKSTRNYILKVLSISYDQFMSIGYMAQEKSLKFIKGGHKEKLEVLSELADLSQWDNRITRVRNKLSSTKNNRDLLESKLSGMQQIVGTMSEPQQADIDSLISKISSIDTQVAKFDEQIAAIVNLKELNVDKANELAIVKSEFVNQIKLCTLEKAKLQDRLNALSKAFTEESFNIRAMPTPVSMSILETNISETNGVIATRRYDLEQLMTGSGKCTRCRTNVTMEHIMRHRELLNVEISSLQEKLASYKEAIKEESAAWEATTYNLLNEALGRYNASKKVIETEIESNNIISETLKSQLDEVNHSIDLLSNGAYDKEINSLSTSRLFSLTECAKNRQKLSELEEKKRKYVEYHSAVHVTKAEIATLETEIKYLSVIDKLFGDKGIKAHKLDNLLSNINFLLQEYIDILSENSVKVWITQYREKATGGTTTDLQIMVQEGDKVNVPFNLYSGGEKQQIVLAFIGALWQVGSQYGSGVNILFLDEIFGPLDSYNVDRVFEYIEHIRSQGRSSIFIVTHNTTIEEVITFDQVWTITKKNHMSTVNCE